jgi:cytochrome c oxidase cbb3-type subunit 3
MRQILRSLSIAVIATSLAIAQGPKGPTTQSPASARPQRTVTPQNYSIQQIQAGELRFSSQCGFCHGRDAAGGETGPDLTRSKLVSEDNRGDKIGPLVRSGRPQQGMPAFSLNDADLAAIVAFIHDQKTKAEALGGGRRSVDDADLATGDAAAGRLYFNGAGGCAACHSATGDLAGITSRYHGLDLLLRMLYPGGRPTPAPPDALSAHFDQLAKYSDDDMHNVYAYLLTLE